MFRLIALLLCFAFPISAQELITPEEFEEISTGKTLYFNNDTGFHGAEQYFPNREVRWKFAEGTCQYGHWYGNGDAICFQYEEEIFPICWLFWKNDGAVTAELLPRNDEPPLTLEFVDTRDVLCGEYLGAKAEKPIAVLPPEPARP